MLLRLAAVVLALTALLALEVASAGERRPVREAPPPRAVASAAPSLVTCSGRLGFPRSVFDAPAGYERGDDPLARALARFLEESAVRVGQPREGWRLATVQGDEAQVVAGRGGGRTSMDFRLEDGEWRWVRAGGCWLRSFVDGITAATWGRVRPRRRLPASATRIGVRVFEDDCTSGRDTSDQLLTPLVHYGRRTVTVTFFVRPFAGAGTCVFTRPRPVTLVLDEPLAGRRLRDGGPHPSEPR